MPILKFKSENFNGETFFKQIINNHLKNKKNIFIMICGGSGEGKSYTALKIAEIIQPDFNPAIQIAYFAWQFLKVIENAKKKKYKVIILDEAHTTIPATKWFDYVNKAVHYVTTTFRQLHTLCVLIVTPNIKLIDKRLREICNYYAVAWRPTNYVFIDFYKIYFNYYDLHNPEPKLNRIICKVGDKLVRIRRIKIKAPSKKLRKRYEKYSKIYKSDILRSKLEEIMKKTPKKDLELFEYAEAEAECQKRKDELEDEKLKHGTD